jgi:thioredoxin 1
MSDNVKEIQKEQFDLVVLQETKPVIVDFWAPWCGPCKAMAPAFEALAETYTDQMVFAKCNVDEQQEVATRYGIKSIPKMMIFKAGEVVHSVTGMVSQGALEEDIKKVLAGEAMQTPFIVN